VPLQRLFLMNSAFVETQAESLAARLTGDDKQKIRQAYRILYGRLPAPGELDLGLSFLSKSNWKEYVRVLLNSNEFEWLN